VAGVDAEKGPAYNDTAMALQAAVAGQGVALARRSLVIDDLRAGLLICPFGPELPTRHSWYFVCAPSSAEQPKVRAFLRWLQDEIARDLGGS
jgi:LysR family glycine cleavage system transcriptional activator